MGVVITVIWEAAYRPVAVANRLDFFEAVIFHNIVECHEDSVEQRHEV